MATKPPPPDLSVLIKTYERPEYIRRCVESVREFLGPDIPVIVADDSREPTEDVDADVLLLPVDSGLGAGRNALLEECATPYALILDDDMFLTERTFFFTAYAAVNRGEYDIVGGRSFGGPLTTYLLSLKDGVFRISKGFYYQQGEFLRCDMVDNYLLVNVEALRSIGGWDAELKLSEHADLFLRAKEAHLRVVGCNNLRFVHGQRTLGDDAFYRSQRNRHWATESIAGASPYMKHWFQKHGITKYIDPNGFAIT